MNCVLLEFRQEDTLLVLRDSGRSFGRLVVCQEGRKAGFSVEWLLHSAAVITCFSSSKASWVLSKVTFLVRVITVDVGGKKSWAHRGMKLWRIRQCVVVAGNLVSLLEKWLFVDWGDRDGMSSDFGVMPVATCYLAKVDTALIDTTDVSVNEGLHHSSLISSFFQVDADLTAEL